MEPIPVTVLPDLIAETPSLSPQRKSEGCFDFFGMQDVGKRIVVGGDDTYRGVFLGRNLRVGFLVGVVKPIGDGMETFLTAESFKTLEELHSRWVLE
jgi:hypothetical protein